MKRKLILLIALLILLILTLVFAAVLHFDAVWPEQSQETSFEQTATEDSAPTGETAASTENTTEETMASWTAEPEVPQITFPAATQSSAEESRPEQNGEAAQHPETSSPTSPEQEATEAPGAPETNETEPTESGGDENELPVIPF